jgi:hypothetical protein
VNKTAYLIPSEEKAHSSKRNMYHKSQEKKPNFFFKK